MTNGAINVALNGTTHNRTLVNSPYDQYNFTNKYHSSHHLLIFYFQFQQIQTEKQHQYTSHKITANTIFLLNIFQQFLHIWNFILLGYNTISICIRNTSANIVIKCLVLYRIGIDMKRLVYFYLLLSQIKTTSVKIYLNNHYFHALAFQTHYV